MSLKISRILHAGYIFEHDAVQIAFDPIFENPFSRNCYAYPAAEFDHAKIKQLIFSAIFISHYHDDHCSLESLAHLRRETPIYLYCLFDEMFSLIRELGFTNVHALKLDEPVNVGSFKVTPRRALDEEVDSIFHIQAGGMNILNVVDSWIDVPTLDLLKETKWDMVLWPFQTMREIEVLAPSRCAPPDEHIPPEWISQLQDLNPRWIVPSSCQFIQENWSWYNQSFFPISYRQFKNEIEVGIPGSAVVRLDPSESLFLNQTSITEAPAIGWIQRKGEQEVDYHFDLKMQPPTTSEIAKHFLPLTLDESRIVYDYCEKELLEKMNALEKPVDIYFDQPRLWRLSVYDHDGQCKHFFYRLDFSRFQDCIEIADGEPPLGWTTEIPISRFYAALELGESLSSLYMRINDFIFDSKSEAEIMQADVIEDPLVRCLYTGVFASYQKAQLKRLK